MENSNKLTFYRKKVAFRLVAINQPSGAFTGIEAANVKEETLTQENPNYDWEKKIFFSLSISEISQIINLLNGEIPECSFFHTTEKNTKTFKMKKMDNGNILFSLDNTDKATSNNFKVNSCSIQRADIPSILIILEEFIKILFYNQ